MIFLLESYQHDFAPYSSEVNTMLIRLAPLFLFVFLSLDANAAQKAVTDDGQVVILNSNGTWTFEDSKATSSPSASLNPRKFSKSSSQSFKVRANPTSMGVYIDPGKWAFSKEKDATNRLSFRSKNPLNADIYGLMISEGIEIEMDSLAEIALENAKEVAPDTRILSKEYRIVNGSKVLFLTMEGTMKSIKAKYVGYYYSNKSGSVQLLVYSSPAIINSKIQEIEEFLNGFVGN
jgi:hypothetical protein